jgi:hypothetical protein
MTRNMPHYQLNLKFRAKKENLPAKRIQAKTMSASLVFQKNFYVVLSVARTRDLRWRVALK